MVGEVAAAGEVLGNGVPFGEGAALAGGAPGEAFGEGDDAAIAPFMIGVLAPETCCH